MSKVLKATFGSPDRPLAIGEFEIPCYVLENEKRVITQRGLLKALGMSVGSSANRGGDRLVKFVGQSRFNNFITNEITVMTSYPIKFKIPGTGGIAFGYEATLLVDICDMVLQAQKKGLLIKQQEHIAERAEMLIRSFAKTGIIALVDEATGYQMAREKDSLQQFLNKFLLEEHAKWVKTFPDDFFEMIFKMKKWTWHYASTKKPGVVGRYINDFIYSRIGPEVLKELQERNPVNESGNRKVRHHQFLTPDYGHPKLKEHIYSVMALGRASGFNWNNFKRLLERAFPKFGETIQIQYDDED